MDERLTEQRRIALLVNPSAGRGRARRRVGEVRSALDGLGLPCRLVFTEGLEHGATAAVEAAEGGEVPVVMSGDGLVGHVGGALAGTGVAMGIVPGGRGNDLARVLGIPTEPEEAARVLATGKVRQIDVGEANGRRFLGIASAGFDSDANRIANEARLVRGPLVYAYAALRALIAWHPASFVVVVDGERHDFRGYSVAAANSKAFGGGMFLAPDAELDDGAFDIVLIEDISKWDYLRGIPKVFKGTHVSDPNVTVLRGAEVEFAADRRFGVYADGDPIAELPARLRLLPRALGVIVPS